MYMTKLKLPSIVVPKAGIKVKQPNSDDFVHYKCKEHLVKVTLLTPIVENIITLNLGLSPEDASQYYGFMKSQSSVSQTIGAKCLALPISKIHKFYTDQSSTSKRYHSSNTFDDNLDDDTNFTINSFAKDSNVIFLIPKKHHDEIIDQLQTNAALVEQAELTEENIRQNPPSYITNPKKKADYVAALRHYFPEKYENMTDDNLIKDNKLNQLQTMLAENQIAANATAEILAEV